MFLSDNDIREAIAAHDIIIDPLQESQIQPASVDLRLGAQFLIPMSNPKGTNFNEPVQHKEYIKEKFVLHPKNFVLATTIERIALPTDIIGFIQGRSSIGRMGLFVQNAGWVDPGFDGQITLELFNATNSSILLEAGRRICQVIFARTETPAIGLGYTGKYQFQNGTTATRIFMDKDSKKDKVQV